MYYIPKHTNYYRGVVLERPAWTPAKYLPLKLPRKQWTVTNVGQHRRRDIYAINPSVCYESRSM